MVAFCIAYAFYFLFYFFILEFYLSFFMVCSILLRSIFRLSLLLLSFVFCILTLISFCLFDSWESSSSLCLFCLAFATKPTISSIDCFIIVWTRFNLSGTLSAVLLSVLFFLSLVIVDSFVSNVFWYLLWLSSLLTIAAMFGFGVLLLCCAFLHSLCFSTLKLAFTSLWSLVRSVPAYDLAFVSRCLFRFWHKM